MRGRRELAERRNLLLRGRRRLLGAVRRGLGDPRDLLHAPHDLANAARLPFRLARERGRELHGGVQVGEDRVERLTHRGRDGADALRGAPALGHGREQLGDLVLRLANPPPHLLGRARALLGELAHLVGHDAEAQPMLPGSGRLDGGVEREQVGLARDAGDRIHELADLARALLERPRRLGDLVQVADEGAEQLARPRDLRAVAERLLRHSRDLALGLLGTDVELRGDRRGRFGILAPVADELALSLRARRQLLGGGGDLLRRRLELLRRRRELLSHRRQLLGLMLHLAHRARDRDGAAVHADPEVAQLVELGVVDPDREVAALHLGQGLARRAQPGHDPRQHGNQRDAGEGEHEGFLREQPPAPPAGARPGAYRRDQGEPGEVENQRLPGLGATEVQRGLERSDHVRHVERVPGGPERGEDHRDQRRPDGDVEVRVPGTERGVAGQAEHRIVGRDEACRECDDEPPRDRHPPHEPDDHEQRHADAHEAPTGARVREHVLALLRAILVGELLREIRRVGHARENGPGGWRVVEGGGPTSGTGS